MGAKFIRHVVDTETVVQEFDKPINIELFRDRCARLKILEPTDENTPERVIIRVKNVATMCVFKDKYQIFRMNRKDDNIANLGYIMLFVEKLANGEDITFWDVFKQATKNAARRIDRELEIIEKDLGAKE